MAELIREASTSPAIPRRTRRSRRRGSCSASRGCPPGRSCTRFPRWHTRCGRSAGNRRSSPQTIITRKNRITMKRDGPDHGPADVRESRAEIVDGVPLRDDDGNSLEDRHGSQRQDEGMRLREGCQHPVQAPDRASQDEPREDRDFHREPALSRVPAITATVDMAEPTERSIPPEIIRTVTPMERMPRVETCCRTLRMFRGQEHRGGDADDDDKRNEDEDDPPLLDVENPPEPPGGTVRRRLCQWQTREPPVCSSSPLRGRRPAVPCSSPRCDGSCS